MNILAALNSLDVDAWIRGLLSAGISGGASALTGGLVVTGLDPAHYSFQTHQFWVLTGSLFMANAVVSMAKFLQGQPLPGIKQVEKTVEITQSPKKPPVTVTTVKETSIEPTTPPTQS
jgi:hypothetical protein